MKTLNIGGSMAASQVSLGCMRMGGLDEYRVDAIMDAALECGINYFDPKRSWGLQPGRQYNRGNYYDTGASFLEDIRSHRNGACGRRIDIRPLMEHLQSGSWRNREKAQEWLEEHADLWR
jgi:hypothetical protein